MVWPAPLAALQAPAAFWAHGELQKATITMAVIWGLLCLTISLVGSGTSGDIRSATQERLQQEQAAQPGNPDLPFTEPPATDNAPAQDDQGGDQGNNE